MYLLFAGRRNRKTAAVDMGFRRSAKIIECYGTCQVDGAVARIGVTLPGLGVLGPVVGRLVVRLGAVGSCLRGRHDRVVGVRRKGKGAGVDRASALDEGLGRLEDQDNGYAGASRSAHVGFGVRRDVRLVYSFDCEIAASGVEARRSHDHGAGRADRHRDGHSRIGAPTTVGQVIRSGEGRVTLNV